MGRWFFSERRRLGVADLHLHLFADEMEREGKFAGLLRSVEAFFAGGAIDAAGEEEKFFELVGGDFEVDFVFVGFAIEREEAFDHLHVLDDFIERFFVVEFFRLFGFGRFFVVLFCGGFVARRFGGDWRRRVGRFCA